MPAKSEVEENVVVTTNVSVDDDTRRSVIRQLEIGKTPRQVGRNLGLTDTQVWRVFRAHYRQNMARMQRFAWRRGSVFPPTQMVGTVPPRIAERQRIESGMELA